MNDPVLQASLEETTALPTFIEYGFRQACHAACVKDGITPLNDEAFAAATTRARRRGLCCAALPLDCRYIIDLPGTGNGV